MSDETQVAPMELVIVAESKLIQDNFTDFKANLETIISSVNTDLKTDEDFNNAKQSSKQLKEIETKLDSALAKVLADFDEISTIVDGVKDLKGLSAEKRKSLDKLVTDRTAELKKKLVDEGICALRLDTSVNREAVRKAIYRKSSFEKMQEAIDAVVNKINEAVDVCQQAIDDHIDEHGNGLIYDKNDLLAMSPDILKVELERRVERERAAKQAALLKEEARKAEEEAAKAKAEAVKVPEEKPAEEPTKEKPVDDVPPYLKRGVQGGGFPAPPKIDSIPVGNAAKQATETPEEEMDRFITEFEAAFGPVKISRSNLKHSKNVMAGQSLADVLREVWIPFKEGKDLTEILNLLKKLNSPEK